MGHPPLAEIAGILDISSDAVKASLSVARKKMRRVIDPSGFFSYLGGSLTAAA